MTPTPHRALRTIASVLVAILAFGTACGVTPSATPTQAGTQTGSLDTALVDGAEANQGDRASAAPDALAFVEDPPPSAAFCETGARIWVHATALNLVADKKSTEVTEIALANVAEWLERATLFAEEDGDVAARHAMFDAFDQLQEQVRSDFDHDWANFRASDAYASSETAQLYENQRNDLVSFIEDDCDALTMADLRNDAADRADELEADFGTAAGSITPSDTVPNHSIYTHGTGRLIVSFPSHWDYIEVTSDAIVELATSEDLEKFDTNTAVDGVRIRLVTADSATAFEALIAGTHIAQSCTQVETLDNETSSRIDTTTNYECNSEFGASLIGQYSPTRGLGVVIEASFDQLTPTRGDIIRLTGIANSLLWS